MHIGRGRKGLWLGLSGFLVVVGVLLIALPFVSQAKSADAGSSAQHTVATSGTTTQSAIRVGQATTAQAAIETTVASAISARRASTPSPATAATVAVAAVPISAPVATTQSVVPPTGPSLEAYRGLGSWVDIYDTKAWKNPSAAVADMAGHGVRTLYIETANSRSSFALKNPPVLATFIREAHARGMLVVAWYLPDMTHTSIDYARIVQAVGFQTSDGQKFDSFALDIESGAIKSESARNRALGALSSRIRGLVGAKYPLGAIIPSPTGLAKKLGYWDAFPYTMLAQTYDVFVPMSYYTYHGKGGSAAYADTLSNVRILRAQKGCSATPIHLIGGIAENSWPSEVGAFVRAAVGARCVGASLYGWSGTTSGDWQELKAIKP